MTLSAIILGAVDLFLFWMLLSNCKSLQGIRQDKLPGRWMYFFQLIKRTLDVWVCYQIRLSACYGAVIMLLLSNL